MPHATDPEPNGMEEDEVTITQRFLAAQNNADAGYDQTLGDLEGNQYQMNDPGEKDDNAVDYEDISDDDLPDDEGEETRGGGDIDGMFGEGDGDVEGMNGDYVVNGDFGNGFDGLNMDGGWNGEVDMKDEKPAGEEDGDAGDFNDLFGEHLSSSPVQERKASVDLQQLQLQDTQQQQVLQTQRSGGLALPGKSGGLALPRPGAPSQSTQHSQFQASPASMSPNSYAGDALSPAASSTMHDEEEEEEEADPLAREQLALMNLAKRKLAGETVDDAWVGGKTLQELWPYYPTYETDEVPKFTQLFGPPPGEYRGKLPAKQPKPVQPTKLSLDLMPDQERSFRTATVAGKVAQDSYTGRNLIECDQGVAAGEDSEDDLALSNIDENEVIGGVSMQDLAVICEDWEIPSEADTADLQMTDGDWEAEEHARPAKKRRTDVMDTDAALAMQHAFLRFEDPEQSTARVARNTMLDMNDPHLLLDEQAPQTRRKLKRVPGDNTHNVAQGKELAQRYNISNDEAYDLLKENHNHKIRSTLGSMAIEHGLPATRLQWPFYKVGLDGKEKRAFHRQPLQLYENPGRTYRFQKSKIQKKKHVRGREPKDLFAKAEDLSFGDNSSALLLEYSEEVPAMLSNFGMGNRFINFYRKKDADDQDRPKREIGETHVLLNQDKSPFHNFGHIAAGEVVPTIQNGMYRAPVFQHKPKNHDFIVAISHTYESGNRLYLRNVENIHTVGQQFPISEVPGEHSRKVTDAAKKRLRAISYRIYAKTLDPARRGITLTNRVLMKHIPGSDIPQTRSKMREFMKYEKKSKNSEEDGYWVPMPGHAVPDVETIRTWIKPEDVCLLDSMQVGVQHLADLGIQDSKDAKEDDEAEDEENVEKMLAPWRTTKNFIQACQGKAMLKVHGEGDPTGRDEAFSMLKTNMKGGYVPRGESAAEKIRNHQTQSQSGHKYNVATQQAKYDRDIRETWDKQKKSLSNEHEASDDEDDYGEPESTYGRAGTPRTSFGTPAFDESASQFGGSKMSFDHNAQEVMVLKRRVRNEMGDLVDTSVRVENPKVIKLYKKKYQERRLARMNAETIKPTGDAETDALARQKLAQELARLERNQDRRLAREKLKARTSALNTAAGSPEALGLAGSPGASDIDATNPTPTASGAGAGAGTGKGAGKGRSKDGTARKCANCGQVGHIKTNRKYVSPSPFVRGGCQCAEPRFEDAGPGSGGARKRGGGKGKGAGGSAAGCGGGAGGAFAVGGFSL